MATLIKLGDIINTVKGYAFKSSWFTSHGTPIVKVKDFTEDSISVEELTYIPESLASQYLKYSLQKDDIIIQTVGSWEHNPNSVVGKVVRTPKELIGSLLNQNAVRLECDKDVDKSYLYYRLKDNSFKNYIIKTAQGAANQASITLDSIRAFQFSLPPFLVQQRIGGILNSYDALIKNNLRRMQLLEEEALCQYRLLVEENQSNMRISNLGSELELNYGKALKATERVAGAYPVYGSSGIVGSHEKYLIKGPGIIIGRKGNIGSVFWSFENFFPIDTVYYVTSEISLYFLYHNLKYDQHFDNSDAAVPGLNRKHALSNKIAIPLKNILDEFDNQCNEIFRLMHNLHQQNLRLREARDILLPLLISGEVDISDVSIADNTIKEILERV